MSCQKCGSSSHWSFECPSEGNGKKPAAKLSRTQLIKLGKAPRSIGEAAPPKTEREEFLDQLKQVEAELLGDDEAECKKHRTEPVLPKVEVKEEVNVDDADKGEVKKEIDIVVKQEVDDGVGESAQHRQLLNRL